MSTVTSPWITPVPEPEKADRRRGLLAPAPALRRKPKLLYAAITVSAIATIAVVQLLFSMSITRNAYNVTRLQDEQTQLARSYQQASQTVDVLSSPQNLAVSADKLGMVSDSTPAYLRLSDGAIVGGTPTPAPATGTTVTAGSGNLVTNAALSNPGADIAAPSAAPVVPAAPVAAAPAAPSTAAPTAATGTAAPDPAQSPGPDSANPANSSASAAKPAAGTPAVNTGKSAASPVPWTGLLPVPTTH